MPVAQKFVGGIIMIALVTTMILPGRNTANVVNAFTGGTANILRTSMGNA